MVVIWQLESGLKKELREMLPIIVYKESFSVRDTHWLATHTTCPLCRLSLLSSAKSPTELSNIQVEVGNSQGPSVAENDGEASLQQSSQPCEQFAELRARDARVPHNTAEENVGRSHSVDCEREQLEFKGQAINAVADEFLGSLTGGVHRESNGRKSQESDRCIMHATPKARHNNEKKNVYFQIAFGYVLEKV
ncbi:hypothetical protein TIFTF001_025596 [Ficus carica]|uniref:Uncharacterized protein n=1 Tax=Ficus carica TaxID=3494 RepID=A0AA88AQ55_FICCA|nr:hypothetical protein TIFTF001_025596 [Ficus carica]